MVCLVVERGRAKKERKRGICIHRKEVEEETDDPDDFGGLCVQTV